MAPILLHGDGNYTTYREFLSRVQFLYMMHCQVMNQVQNYMILF